MSQLHAVTAENAPPALGPYSQGMVAGRLLFSSGQLPLGATGADMPSSIEEQTRRVLSNLDAVARAAGSSLSREIEGVFGVEGDDEQR